MGTATQQRKMPRDRSLLQRLQAGEIILGDGNYCHTLERRGWCLAGFWTPEAAAENPAAIEQLATEYSRCGADVTQTYTFQAAALQGTGFPPGCNVTSQQVNEAACAVAARVRDSRGVGSRSVPGFWVADRSDAVYRARWRGRW